MPQRRHQVKEEHRKVFFVFGDVPYFYGVGPNSPERRTDAITGMIPDPFGNLFGGRCV
jgi:hypothetical protein